MGTAYTAGTVITMAEGDAGADIVQGCVIVDGGRLAYVGPLSGAPLEGHEVVPLGPEATILPGLIDTHVHLSFDGSADPVSVIRSADDRTALAIMLRSARQLLSVGVTTARDLGAPGLLDQTVRSAVDGGLARGPRLVTTNAPLTVTGGHCWFFGAECDGVEGVRRQVRLARKNGADAIKIMSTGGNMTPGTLPSEPQFTAEELTAIVDEAHRYGLRVTAHAHGAEGIRRAIAAGVDSLEHFSFQERDGSMREVPELVQQAASKGIYVCKTLCAAWARVLDGGEHVPFDMMRTLVDRGVKVVAGTDAGIDNTPHAEYVLGLEGMAAFGMTESEVLAAATHLAAESLGLAAETGSLEVGKSADLIAVAGDPRRDLGALRELRAVVVRGERYTPEFRSELTWNGSVVAPQYMPAGYTAAEAPTEEAHNELTEVGAR